MNIMKNPYQPLNNMSLISPSPFPRFLAGGACPTSKYYFIKGPIYYAVGNKPETILAFNKAIEIIPDYSPPSKKRQN